MTRRIDVRIDRLVVDRSLGRDPRAHARAIEAALGREAPALRATAGPDAVLRALSAALARGGDR